MIRHKPMNLHVLFQARTRGAVTATILTAVIVTAAGCASTADMEALREAPGFSAGYGDGCSTATEEDKSFSTKQTRDEYSFKNDDAYRAGWRQGYLECSHTTPEAKDGGRILGERNEY